MFIMYLGETEHTVMKHSIPWWSIAYRDKAIYNHGVLQDIIGLFREMDQNYTIQ